MHTRSTITASVVLLIATCYGTPGQPAEPSPKPPADLANIQPGDSVVVTVDRSPLMLDGKVVAELPRGAELIVDQVKGDLVGGYTLGIKTRAGWVKKGNLRPAILLRGPAPPAKAAVPVIPWPAPLMDVRFAERRHMAEGPFQARQTRARPITEEDYRRILWAARHIDDMLHDPQRNPVAAGDLKICHDFLDALIKEVQARLAAPPSKTLPAAPVKAGGGLIPWPAILMDARFAQPREAIEKPFRQRQASRQPLGDRDYRDIISAAWQIEALLKHDADAIPPADYRQAKEFLDRLVKEAKERLSKLEKK